MAYKDQYNRLWGNMEIGNCVVNNTNNSLEIQLSNGEVRLITIPSKTYKFDDVKRKSEVVDWINGHLQSLGAKVRTIVGGVKKDIKYNCLIIAPTEAGITVTAVTGSFAVAYFE